MSDHYAYSYNGENYRGSFATRDLAYQAALACMGGLLTLPQTIYVGKMVGADLHATGLGRTVVNDMASRSRLDGGAEGFLNQVTPQQLAELDATLELAVRGWLQKNDLMPRFFSVDSISEHPLPPTPAVHSIEAAEVSDLGDTEYPADVVAAKR